MLNIANVPTFMANFHNGKRCLNDLFFVQSVFGAEFCELCEKEETNFRARWIKTTEDFKCLKFIQF